MNWLAFIASMVGSLAWPLTVIVVVLIFRRQLLAAAPWLRELEIGSLKLKFAEGLAKVSSEAEKIEALPQAAEGSALPAAPPDTTLLLATHAPRALVLESWIHVEAALSRARRKPAGVRPEPPLNNIMRDLIKQGRLPQSVTPILLELRTLRNDAVHLPEFAINTEQALEYARLSDRVVAALDAVASLPD